MGGISKYYWDYHPPWALWATRLLVYGCPLWYSNVRQMVLLYCKSKWYFQISTARRGTSAASATASEAEGKTCHANILHMALPSKVTALCQSPCTDNNCELTPILREGHISPKLPRVSLREGVDLCKTHRDIYRTPRSNQVCSATQCFRLGVSGPECHNYFATHMPYGPGGCSSCGCNHGEVWIRTTPPQGPG